MQDVQQILDLVNTGGVTLILVAIAVMFWRGDIMSRKVYEELTKKMLEEVVRKVIDRLEEILEERDIKPQ